MARARKSHKVREEETKPTKRGPAPAYRTGRPGENPFVVYCDYRRADLEVPKVLILSFGEKYAAKWFIDRVLEGDSYKWVNPIGSRDCIQTESLGIKISMFRTKQNDLEAILEYEPTSLEEEWSDEQVLKHISRFKYGRSEEEREARTSQVSDDTSGGEVSVRSSGKIKKPKKEKKEPKPKIDKTGLISANDLAKELGVEGREVRGVLRAMKLVKPEGGWLFDKKTAAEIKEKVKKGLKEAKKKKSKK